MYFSTIITNNYHKTSSKNGYYFILSILNICKLQKTLQKVSQYSAYNIIKINYNTTQYREKLVFHFKNSENSNFSNFSLKTGLWSRWYSNNIIIMLQSTRRALSGISAFVRPDRIFWSFRIQTGSSSFLASFSAQQFLNLSCRMLCNFFNVSLLLKDAIDDQFV